MENDDELTPMKNFGGKVPCCSCPSCSGLQRARKVGNRPLYVK